MERNSEKKTLSQKEIRQTLFASTVGAACIGGSATLVFPFLPLYLLDLGADESTVALWNSVIISGMFIMGAIVMPVWGALADRVGKKKMIIRSAACLSISYFLSYIAQSPWQLLGARLFQGFSFGFIPVSQALLSEISGSHAGTASGILLGGRSVGTMIGPFLGGIIGSLLGLRLPFLISGVIDLLAVFLVLFLVKEPYHEPKEKKKKEGLLVSFRKLSRNKKFMGLILLMIINQCGLLIVNPLISLHVAELTGGNGDIPLLSGLICGAAGIAGALGGPFWGRFGEHQGFMKAAMISFAGAGVFSALQFAAPNTFLFGAAQFGFGFFTIGGITSISGAVPEVISKDELGSAYGINAAAMNVGNCLGPLLGGGLAAVFGRLGPVFAAAAILQLAAGLYIWMAHSRSAKNA